MEKWVQNLLTNNLKELSGWNKSFGEWQPDSSLDVQPEKAEQLFKRLTRRLKCNYPFEHPVYAGQMLKPPHEIARAAYALAMSINPNNHALDGGPPSSEMEKEVIAKLAYFFGYGEEYLGHLTSGGTIANLEALWIARESHPQKKIAFSEKAHYTHSRMCSVLQAESVTISTDDDGAFNLEELNPDDIGTVVVTMGTTGLGDVEPLHQILPWAKKHGIRIHIDAAYGGFFHCLKGSGLIDEKPWQNIHEADSIVMDPHKHGLQPYGCGCILFKDPAVGKFYKHDSPYTYFTSEELHLGEISLECSRAGAAAVAFWATLELFPLKEHEGFGPILAKCRKAALKMEKLIDESEKLKVYKSPHLDIFTYFPIPQAAKITSAVSDVSKKVFEKGMRDQSFYLSLYKIPSEKFVELHPDFKADSDSVTILRSVFMKPEHEDFVEELVREILNVEF